MSGVIARRGFLTAMGATVMTAGGLDAVTGQTQQAVPWSSGTEPPKLKAPPNACDCHMHIYDSRFPVAPKPSAAAGSTVAAIAGFRSGSGRRATSSSRPRLTGRTIPQPRRDGRVGGTARGVAVVDTSVTDAELRRLNDGGIRGIRFNLVISGGQRSTCLSLCRSGSTISAGMSKFNMLGDPIIETADLLQRLPSPIVFDLWAAFPSRRGSMIRRSHSC